MKVFLISFFSLVVSLAYAQNRSLTPQQMHADLDYLNKYLKKWHPTYYDYTHKEQMAAYYSLLKNNCSQDTAVLFFATMVRKAMDKVGCGHIVVSGSVKKGKTPPLLPINVWALNNHLFLRSS